jgi:hypothetical protein
VLRDQAALARLWSETITLSTPFIGEANAKPNALTAPLEGPVTNRMKPSVAELLRMHIMPLEQHNMPMTKFIELQRMVIR